MNLIDFQIILSNHVQSLTLTTREMNYHEDFSAFQYKINNRCLKKNLI